MLFAARFHDGLRDGSITLTIRAWTRPQVVAGRTYKTPAGVLAVDAIERVKLSSITDRDAKRAGFGSLAALVKSVGHAELVYRIELRHVGAVERDRSIDEPVTSEDFATIIARLDRMDGDHPWTLRTLELIERCPATRAGDLADALGRELQTFKKDVRRLKALGLTESLEVGYRLSPRGESFLTRSRLPDR